MMMMMRNSFLLLLVLFTVTCSGYIYSGSLCRNRFSCHGIKKCVPFSRVCNRVDDCGDGSDEANCKRNGHRGWRKHSRLLSLT